jgi:DNA-binding winged helix-turn-helix (wHTH) protein
MLVERACSEKAPPIMASERSISNRNYWTEFPETYRVEAIATIAKWIAVGDSGVIVGGSGTGKSNLVGFFTTRPDVIGKHLPNPPEQYAFLHMDVNSLPAITTPYFYRSMLFTLQRAAAEIDPALVQEIRQSMAGLFGAEDTMGLHLVLQQAHDLIVNQGGKQIVWLIDRFDEACVRLEASTLNSLRNLRDHNRVKGRLSYLLFTRHPLARLREPHEYDEFHEIVVSNICWVGPMVTRDAEWMARQMAERHHVSFGKPAVDLLIELSGGLPAFMKAACTALATGILLPDETVYTWLDRILALQPVQRNCQEMWDDLKPEEKSMLSAITAGVTEDKLDAAIVHYLEQASLVTRVSSDDRRVTRLKIFSPIFELFVMRQKIDVIGDITIDPESGALKVNGRTLTTKLMPPEHRLLAYLVDHKGQICTKADLIAHVWPGQTPASLEQEQQLLILIEQVAAKLAQGGQTGIMIQSIEEQGCRLVEAGQLESLRIVIDEDKFHTQVKEIVDSDFFQNLQLAAQNVRRSRSI